MKRALSDILSKNWPLLLVLAIWQAWVTFARVSAIVAPTPLAVGVEFLQHPGLYVGETLATLTVAITGLAVGVALAFVAAIVTWFSPIATQALTMPAILVQATPIVALIPVLARVMGYGRGTVVAAAVLITIFPTFVLAASGLHAYPPGARELFAAIGAGKRARLLHLAIPSAVPHLLVALRIASTNCILAALIAEYLMGTVGLGRLFATAEGQFDTASAWAACLVATAISVAAFLATRRLERAIEVRFYA